MSAGVVVIVEISPAGLTPASVKTISFARRLAAAAGEDLLVLVPGCFPPPGGRQAGGYLDDNHTETLALLEQIGGEETIFLSGDSLTCYNPEAWKEALAPLCRELAPHFVCVPHTSRGWDYGPGLALRLGASLIGAVEGFRRHREDFLFQRSLFKGQWQEEVLPEKAPVVLTVLPEAAVTAGGAVTDSETAPGKADTAEVTPRDTAPADTKAKADAAGNSAGTAVADAQGTHLPFSSPCDTTVPTPPATLPSSSPFRTAFYTAPALPNPRCRPLGKLPVGEKAYDFSAAEVIVAAGQGIGAAENLELIHRLAGLFPKGAVGCSRAVCDRGWMEYRRQIGLTGRTVAPPLYIACGISGAMPHLAGMRDSRCIIAINRDRNAAIFQIAHLGIVADLLGFIPTVLEEAAQERRHASASFL
ncbi:MAG: electron transfer flavoprotein subunit alpha/FixB family protein [Syntrophobacterales bacterium]|nr:electron transfer flavoprotein subunit alpha/FixB family protein [Syntrophobacterales bacterium]